MDIEPYIPTSNRFYVKYWQQPVNISEVILNILEKYIEQVSNENYPHF